MISHQPPIFKRVPRHWLARLLWAPWRSYRLVRDREAEFAAQRREDAVRWGTSIKSVNGSPLTGNGNLIIRDRRSIIQKRQQDTERRIIEDRRRDDRPSSFISDTQPTYEVPLLTDIVVERNTFRDVAPVVFHSGGGGDFGGGGASGSIDSSSSDSSDSSPSSSD